MVNESIKSTDSTQGHHQQLSRFFRLVGQVLLMTMIVLCLAIILLIIAIMVIHGMDTQMWMTIFVAAIGCLGFSQLYHVVKSQQTRIWVLVLINMGCIFLAFPVLVIIVVGVGSMLRLWRI
ncbi:hypothetical protein [Neisseria sp. Ec49-e6-T10]|uniref:hypothetical protein n=1 Tax=Neisseria sp. Ec49-e6-T10 TaxID=3140744 RepID=UPI003EC11545